MAQNGDAICLWDATVRYSAPTPSVPMFTVLERASVCVCVCFSGVYIYWGEGIVCVFSKRERKEKGNKMEAIEHELFHSVC